MLTEAVSLPLWLVVLACLLAALSLLERFFLPSMRWFLQRRLNRLIAEMNSRLNIRIPAFTLARRRVLINSLTYDPEVLAAVERQAREESLPHDVLMERVGRYAREIVPAFNAYLYFRVGMWLARRLARNLYRVRLTRASEEALAAVDPDAAVVFVMNHRSNMDYVLVGFLASRQAALSFAAGEWARVWPLQSLVRAMGAYFVRRDSDNTLYRRVLQRYVHMAVAGGVTQAVFLEGGLSRDGRLRPPRLGLLGYMVRGYSPQQDRDIVFVPVGINYDRVLEDESLLAMTAARATRQGTRRALGTGVGFLLRNLFMTRRRDRTRFGYAAVNFGPPLSFKAYCMEHSLTPAALAPEARNQATEELGERLMSAIARAIPVPPIPLVARLLSGAPEAPADETELLTRLEALVAALRERGVCLSLPGDTPASALRAALRTLIERGLMVAEEGRYRVIEEKRPLIAYYANSIAHLVE